MQVISRRGLQTPPVHPQHSTWGPSAAVEGDFLEIYSWANAWIFMCPINKLLPHRFYFKSCCDGVGKGQSKGKGNEKGGGKRNMNIYKINKEGV